MLKVHRHFASEIFHCSETVEAETISRRVRQAPRRENKRYRNFDERDLLKTTIVPGNIFDNGATILSSYAFRPRPFRPSPHNTHRIRFRITIPGVFGTETEGGKRGWQIYVPRCG